jgi:DNA sulfur modification protein DndC
MSNTIGAQASPRMYDSNLWGDERMSIQQSIRLTAEKLNAQLLPDDHVVIAFSGGKDSTTVVTLFYHLMLTGQIARPRKLTVMFADTGMESPPLIAAAHMTLSKLQEYGIATQVVRPALDDRFFTYMLGRGVPPPTNRQRWCTRLLKIKPMDMALEMIREACPEDRMVLLTGVRRGESVARDQRLDKVAETELVGASGEEGEEEEPIAPMSCSKENAECSQGHLQTNPPKSVKRAIAPILHWRVCRVWDWLMLEAPMYGFNTAIVAEVYGDEESHEEEARTGCIGCNLVTKDHMLERLLKNERWSYLAPLQQLRPLYAEWRRPANRFRADGLARRKDGELLKRGMALGPLTFEARLAGLSAIKAIQQDIERAAQKQGMPTVSLIEREEEARIRELIAARTMPMRWTGDEVTGDVLIPLVVAEGVIQPLLYNEEGMDA